MKMKTAEFSGNSPVYQITISVQYQQWPEKIRLTDSIGNTFTIKSEEFMDFLSNTQKPISEATSQTTELAEALRELYKLALYRSSFSDTMTVLDKAKQLLEKYDGK